jgi:hypothetical protein
VLCCDPLQYSGGGELVVDSLEKSRRSSMGKLQSDPLDDSPYTSIIFGGSLWVSERDRECENGGYTETRRCGAVAVL